MKARVNTYLNIRTGKPEVLPGNNPNDAYYKPGDEIEIAGTITGEDYKGNNKWYKLSTGVFVWSGGVDDPNAYHWWINDFGIDEVWKKTKGEGVTIILLDTGVTPYPEINPARITLMNAHDTPDTADTFYHGTLMSAIILGNGPEIMGVAPDSEIISIKITSNGDLTARDLLDGLTKAESLIRDDKAYVINCSLSISNDRVSTGDLASIRKSLEKINSHKNVVVTAAVGNMASTDKTIPAGFDHVISCAGLRKGRSYVRLGLSNYWDTISLTAPGDFPVQEINHVFNGTAQPQGSSHACAYTSGLIALFLSMSLIQGNILDFTRISAILLSVTDRIIMDDIVYFQLNREKLIKFFMEIHQ